MEAVENLCAYTKEEDDFIFPEENIFLWLVKIGMKSIKLLDFSSILCYNMTAFEGTIFLIWYIAFKKNIWYTMASWV